MLAPTNDHFLCVCRNPVDMGIGVILSIRFLILKLVYRHIRLPFVLRSCPTWCSVVIVFTLFYFLVAAGIAFYALEVICDLGIAAFLLIAYGLFKLSSSTGNPRTSSGIR